MHASDDLNNFIPHARQGNIVQRAAAVHGRRTGMFDLMKKFAGTYSDVKVTGEKINGYTAVSR
jgi:hypothetical protein